MKIRALALLLPLLFAGCREKVAELDFVPAARETLLAEISTNGKVEPAEWTPVRAPRAGLVARVVVKLGDRVSAGSLLAELDTREERAEVQRAEARLQQARAELAVLAAGGRAAERAALDASVRQLNTEADQLRREISTLDRLLARKAATVQEKTALADRLAAIEAQLAGLAQRRAALSDALERSPAEARVREAGLALDLARQKVSEASLVSPRAGVVYALSVKAGSYLQPGDAVAEIGDLSQLRIRVFVDELDLGRVQRNLPAVFTWDGLPGRRWEGAVEALPSQVSALGSRQVGEVLTRVSSPQQDLPAGANVNARIRTNQADNALSLPKECLLREQSQTYVFVLEKERLRKRAVRTGASSATRVEIVDGVKENERAAVLTGDPLADGQLVRSRGK